jgi:hypothetical protein
MKEQRSKGFQCDEWTEEASLKAHHMKVKWMFDRAKGKQEKQSMPVCGMCFHHMMEAFGERKRVCSPFKGCLCPFKSVCNTLCYNSRLF